MKHAWGINKWLEDVGLKIQEEITSNQRQV
jgi:hypothetical protein